MALNLYRRHRKECEGAHPEDTRTGQFEEGRRGWKKCACLIHLIRHARREVQTQTNGHRRLGRSQVHCCVAATVRLFGTARTRL